MGLSVVTPPTAYPVTLEEARAHLRVIATDDDALILSLVRSATAYVERQLDMALMQRTLKLTLDAFTDAIELPRGPVTEVVSVDYVDGDGAPQTAASSLYSTDLISRSQWVILNSDASWPTTLSAANAVSITYKAGFVTLPEYYHDLKAAILFLVGHWFANREAVIDRAANEVPLTVDAILQPYRPMLV